MNEETSITDTPTMAPVATVTDALTEAPVATSTNAPTNEPEDTSTIPNVTVDMKNILEVLARVMPSIDTMPFETIDSPQNKALKWLAEVDSIIQYPLPGPDDMIMPEYSISVNDGIESEDGENDAMTMEGGQTNGMMMMGMIEINTVYINTRRLVERYALAVFFFSTTTDDDDMADWLKGDEDACSWFGITCEYYPPMEGEDMMNGGNMMNADMSMKVISGIELVNNGIKGTIPSELVLLQSLETLSLDANELEGSVPESLGSLPNLSFLKIDNNMLTGKVPDSLCVLESNGVLKDLIATCDDGETEGGVECDCCTECL